MRGLGGLFAFYYAWNMTFQRINIPPHTAEFQTPGRYLDPQESQSLTPHPPLLGGQHGKNIKEIYLTAGENSKVVCGSVKVGFRGFVLFV